MDTTDQIKSDSSRTRSFWIQGRSGPHWQNLENIADAQAAILRLGDLVSQDRYDELKLLESQFSPITGETDYLHIVTIRDGQVLEKPDPGAPVQQEITNEIVVPDGQMALWEPEDDTEENRQEDFWKIDPGRTDEPDTAEPESHHAEPFLDISRGAAEPDGRGNRDLDDHAKTQGPQQDIASLVAGLTKRRSDRQAEKQVPNRRRADARQKQVSRGVLLSGALAGAFSIGLAIAAMNPQSASSIFEILMHGPSIAPSSQPDVIPDIATAITGNNPQITRQALLAGADPNQRDAEGTPLLLKAARHGLPMTVNLLLQAGADPATPMAEGRSVLHLTAAEGLAEPLKLMLRAGAEPDLPGGVHGCLTPLGLAAANGRVRAVGVLTEFNASLDPLPGCDISPIELAAAYPIVRSRLEAAAAARRKTAVAEVGAKETPTATTPLPISLDVPERSVPQEKPELVALTLPQVIDFTDLEPNAPIVENIIQPERTVLPEPVDLASNAPESTLEVAALTSTGTGDSPRAPVRPALDPDPVAEIDNSAITEDIRLDAEIARLIEEESPDKLRTLLDTHGDAVDLASLEIPVLHEQDVSFRNPVDYAVLSGKLSHAQTLIDAGGKAGRTLLHDIVDRQNQGKFHPALHFLLKNSTNANEIIDGVTPLMRAARNDDDRTTTMLLAYGADPKVVSDTGMKAADFAAESKSVDIQEKLVIAEAADDYKPLMFGLSWYDTLDKVKPRTEACKPVSDGFVACKLAVPSWLNDTSAVIAQFDTHNDDRLVALQIDSALYSNELEARKGFDDAVAKINGMVPAGQQGFSVRELAQGMPYFESLKPTVNASNDYHYWPDDDRSKPVYLHLKMIGYSTRQGFHRLIIGNPFRIG
ncbi:MAG: ankyrin repeat domain-containing protein [Alphaproteobacteria bacterium]